MAKVCAVCGKGSQIGHNVSHANNKTFKRLNRADTIPMRAPPFTGFAPYAAAIWISG
jgi:hypothetical protein